ATTCAAISPASPSATSSTSRAATERRRPESAGRRRRREGALVPAAVGRRLGRLIADVVVALTDYGLALECAILARLLWRGRRPAPSLDIRFAVFFGATALAALAGGTFHGFVSDTQRTAGALLWRVTLLAIGVAATMAWQAGAGLLLSP